ncbi:hypothetical protein DFS34DRAFT_317955 [Phlyctochytrium arcticum]|nr:hypothetical protein DFS34DRAFT_317955 [Phlyctochytrium arcticum]
MNLNSIINNTMDDATAAQLYKGIRTLSTKGTAEEVNENLQDWLVSAKNWLKGAPIVGRIELLQNKMDRHAAHVVQNATSANHLMTLLGEAYATKGSDSTALLKILRLKQTGTIAQYKQEFNEFLRQREERIAESVSMIMFINGLKDDIHVPVLNEVKLGRLTTLRATQAYVDSYQFTRESAKVASSSNNAFDAQAHHTQHGAPQRTQCEICHRDNHRTANCFILTRAKQAYEQQGQRNAQSMQGSSARFGGKPTDKKRRFADAAHYVETEPPKRRLLEIANHVENDVAELPNTEASYESSD